MSDNENYNSAINELEFALEYESNSVSMLRVNRANVYALLAIADEIRETRKLLEDRRNAVILDGTN